MPMKRCSECGNKVDERNHWSLMTHNEEYGTCVCIDCMPWDEKARDKSYAKRRLITPTYEAFFIGDRDTPKQWRGFGGRKFTIVFDDGRIVKTDNLWFDGFVPEHYRDRLQPNGRLFRGWDDDYEQHEVCRDGGES